MTLAAEGAVWARGAFRLTGSLVPRNGRATICAVGRDAETSPGGTGGGARSCTPDGLGYALIPACDRPQRRPAARAFAVKRTTIPPSFTPRRFAAASAALVSLNRCFDPSAPGRLTSEPLACRKKPPWSSP